MLGKSGRLVIRPSGTEPLIRVMGEAEDRSLVERAVEAVCEAVRQTPSSVAAE
jgi:phosphoglucosamine mutase